MEPPIGSSSTSEEASTSSTNQVPSPAPPFFASPFLAPFLPQGAVPSPNLQQLQQFQQMAGEQNGRVNPFTGGLFLAPNQYQEMMQQYFQSLMMQAGGQMPVFCGQGNQFEVSF